MFKELKTRRGLLVGGSAAAAAALAACTFDASGNTEAEMARLRRQAAAGGTPAPALTPSADAQRRAAEQAATQGSSERRTGTGYKIPAPTDFRPEVAGGVQNRDPKDAVRDQWFHLMVPKAGRQPIVDTYATYWARCSDDIRLESHGNEGEIIIQVKDGVEQAVVRVGVGTLDVFEGKQVWKDKKWGNEAPGYNENWITAVNFKGGPANNPVRVYDADTGALVAEGATNQYSDVLVQLSNVGRSIVEFQVTDPTKGNLEIRMWAGPDDRINRKDINRIDARR